MPRRPKPSGRALPDKGRPLAPRRVGGRVLRPRWLIVCEGEKTEPNYFRRFQKARVEVVGAGADPSQVVKQALTLQAQARAQKQPFDVVWVVFDRDDFAHFNAAIDQARAKGLQVAYSNQAFELWYLLHFCYLNTGIDRAAYVTRLAGYLGQPYRKNDITLFDSLLPHQATAVSHARRLWESYQPHHRPDRDNPCTTVYQLVEALNALADDG